MILPYKYKGNPIHFFALPQCGVYVTRGKVFCAALDRDKHGLFVAVTSPAGMSYRQASLEAVKRFSMNTENRPPTQHDLIAE